MIRDHSYDRDDWRYTDGHQVLAAAVTRGIDIQASLGTGGGV